MEGTIVTARRGRGCGDIWNLGCSLYHLSASFKSIPNLPPFFVLTALFLYQLFFLVLPFHHLIVPHLSHSIFASVFHPFPTPSQYLFIYLKKKSTFSFCFGTESTLSFLVILLKLCRG